MKIISCEVNKFNFFFEYIKKAYKDSLNENYKNIHVRLVAIKDNNQWNVAYLNLLFTSRNEVVYFKLLFTSKYKEDVKHKTSVNDLICIYEELIDINSFLNRFSSINGDLVWRYKDLIFRFIYKIPIPTQFDELKRRIDCNCQRQYIKCSDQIHIEYFNTLKYEPHNFSFRIFDEEDFLDDKGNFIDSMIVIRKFLGLKLRSIVMPSIFIIYPFESFKIHWDIKLNDNNFVLKLSWDNDKYKELFNISCTYRDDRPLIPNERLEFTYSYDYTGKIDIIAKTRKKLSICSLNETIFLKQLKFPKMIIKNLINSIKKIGNNEEYKKVYNISKVIIENKDRIDKRLIDTLNNLKPDALPYVWSGNDFRSELKILPEDKIKLESKKNSLISLLKSILNFKMESLYIKKKRADEAEFLRDLAIDIKNRIEEETTQKEEGSTETLLESFSNDIKRLSEKFIKFNHLEGKKINQKAIKDWLIQFETAKRIDLTLRLLKHILFIDRNYINDTFSHFITNKLTPTERSKVIVTNLGGPYDSSYLMSYFLGDTCMNLEIPSADLRSILDNKNPNNHIILFIDDNIGSGKQAFSIFQELLGFKEKILRETHQLSLSKNQIERLKQFEIFLFFVIGFEEGKETFNKYMKELKLNIKKIYSFVKAEENIGCFHSTSQIFDNEDDRLEAMEMCQEIGFELFSDKNWSKELKMERSLGYGNSQKLYVFSYNVPTSTLPILWKRGKYNNKKWEPLFLRRKKLD